MNLAVVIGRLTKDPDLRTTTSGLSVCTFTVAVNRRFGNNEDVDFIPVVTWRGLADNCATYLKKGKKVAVSGRIQVRSYEAKDGSKRYVTEIIAGDVEFLTPKSDTDTLAEAGLYGDPDFEPTDEEMPF